MESSKKNNREAYFIAKECLDTHCFDPDRNDFEDSEIQRWLDEEFLKAAFFFCYEKVECIVSLPSKEEMEDVSFGFKDNESKRASSLDWSLAHFGNVDARYWTKKPCETSHDNAMIVYDFGIIEECTYLLNDVCPVLLLKTME